VLRLKRPHDGQNLGKVCEKILRRDRKSLRQLYDIFQRHISLTSLDSTDIITVQSRSFSQFFLRVASFVA